MLTQIVKSVSLIHNYNDVECFADKNLYNSRNVNIFAL